MLKKTIFTAHKGFSIPIVVSLVLLLSIALFSIQMLTSQSARSALIIIQNKKAEYIAEAGLKRVAGVINSNYFEQRVHKGGGKFSFGYIKSFTEVYGGGQYTVTAVDFPSMVSNFNMDFRCVEYLGVFIWSKGMYKDSTRFVFGILTPRIGALPMFKYKRGLNSEGSFEFNNIEVN